MSCLPSHTTFLLLVHLVTLYTYYIYICKRTPVTCKKNLVQVGTAKMQSTPGTPPTKKHCWAALPSRSPPLGWSVTHHGITWVQWRPLVTSTFWGQHNSYTGKSMRPLHIMVTSALSNRLGEGCILMLLGWENLKTCAANLMFSPLLMFRGKASDWIL